MHLDCLLITLLLRSSFHSDFKEMVPGQMKVPDGTFSVHVVSILGTLNWAIALNAALKRNRRQKAGSEGKKKTTFPMGFKKNQNGGRVFVSHEET